jgi:flagellin
MPITITPENRFSPSARAYSDTSARLADTAARLTLGTRILRTGDDVASVTLAASLDNQTNSLRSGRVNGARATSYLQTAGDGIARIRNVLTALSDLTSTALAAGVTPLQFATLDAQFQRARAGIDTIVATTTFNGSAILDGSANGSSAPGIPLGNGSSISLPIGDFRSAALLGGPLSIGSTTTATTTAATLSNTQQTVDEAIAQLDAFSLRLRTADQASENTLASLARAQNSLIATDRESETATRETLRLRQQTAATLIAAQVLGLNNDLLGLVAA